MVFFRIKKIKGKEYAYIVENKWKRKTSRQKVKGYLGRAYRFDLRNNVDFFEFLKIENVNEYIENNNINNIINDLVGWELYRFNINKNEFSIDLNNKKIQKNDKNVAFMINEGFMCGFTLKNLLDFKPEGDEQDEGYRLARVFVEAGIKVPQEIFIGIYQKLLGS